jgi:hypothetical protein
MITAPECLTLARKVSGYFKWILSQLLLGFLVEDKGKLKFLQRRLEAKRKGSSNWCKA